jgi:hypothetical protein
LPIDDDVVVANRFDRNDRNLPEADLNALMRLPRWGESEAACPD